MSDLKVQFIHGLESSPQSTKARVLAEHFASLTPGMLTDDFEACVALQHRALEEFGPDVLVASSFGGAVAVALLQRGLWRGPTLLLAQAALRQGQTCELPEDVVVWLVHGTHDEIVDPEDSRRLSACGSADLVRLIEVDDNHVLRTSVRDGSLVRWVREISAAR
ncbi:MAG: hypothetical protein O7F08_09380 [Deltaproteobacteria bacterium]|nr:hypothetical protein [Deltaproteobacteria bacterium]